MAKIKEEQQNRYFQHDEDASKDDKILEMQRFFDMNKNDFSEIDLKSLLPIAALGTYWKIIEYMHKHKLPVDKIATIAYDFRIPESFLQTVLDNFSLFRTEDGEYINDRILRNKALIQERTTQKSANGEKAANARWLLPTFNKEYQKLFGETPILTDEEIKKLYNYLNKIENFKELLPDILLTLKGLKFDTDINFKPCANWLLKDNNLAKIANGEFGKLKKNKKESDERKKNEDAAKKQLDSGIENDLFIFDEYRCTSNVIKLEAQKRYSAELEKGNDGKAAINAARLYCKEQEQQEDV